MPNLDHPLDRPVWGSLNAGWRPLAQSAGAALRLAPDYGPFAATPRLTVESLRDLVAFDLGAGGIDLVEHSPVEAPEGLVIALQAPLVQMTARAIGPGEPDFEVVPLTEADGVEMLGLAELTRPGPFARRTQALGGFIGVKLDRRLVAMAGQRMRPEGFCEVSGVCTHPDHRGQGYASGLMRLVARRIIGRGETPFLHAYATNTPAIALYESLGFEVRRQVALTILKRAEQ